MLLVLFFFLGPAFFLLFFLSSFARCYVESESNDFAFSASESHHCEFCVVCFGPLAISSTATESLCLTAYSQKIIGVEKSAACVLFLLFIIFCAIHIFRISLSVLLKMKSAFDVESESFTFTSAPKNHNHFCQADYRCCTTLLLLLLLFSTFFLTLLAFLFATN